MKSRMFLPIVVSSLSACVLGSAAVLIWGTNRDDAMTVAGLVPRLKDDVTTHRRDAATALGQVVGPGAKDAAKALIESLRDADAEVRARSARSLGTLVTINPKLPLKDSTVSALLSGLHDPNLAVRAAATIGLRSLGQQAEGMFDAALEGLRTDDSSLKVESAAFLSTHEIRDANDLRRLLKLLDDPDAMIERTARNTLLRRGLSLSPEIALSVLATALRTGSPTIREVAATMLGRSIPRILPARDLLRLALRDKAPVVRLAAAAALGAFSEDGLARSALRVATDDPDLCVRATASASLAVGRRATRAEALTNLWLALINDPGRIAIVDQIGTDPDRAVPRLLEALGDRSPRVRAAAAQCLGEVVPPPALTRITLEALTIALTDRVSTVRQASATALARYGSAAVFATEALKRAVQDQDRRVSAQALTTLRGLDATQVR